MEDSVNLTIGGVTRWTVPRWQGERIRRLVESKAIRSVCEVEAELSRLIPIETRVRVVGEHAIEIDGRLFEFKRKLAAEIREAIADGKFEYSQPTPWGWVTGEECRAIGKLMGIKTKRNGLDDYSAWNKASSWQRQAIQVQIDELTRRDLWPDHWKFRHEPPADAVGFKL